MVVPGGFSYGDYLRAGAIARFSPAMGAVARFAAEGGPVLGICNGFQVLCESGLLPGALLPNAEVRFVCRQVSLAVESDRSPFLAGAAGESLSIPVKHQSGRFWAPDEVLDELEANGQVALRYETADNINGSARHIAGVTNEAGQRARPDAAPRACGRPADRVHRRAAHVRGAGGAPAEAAA